ncbi:MAG: twin-arginine translocase subunit TatB [Rhodobacteraceae bacterium]|nr:twin-arginine translocase subunit TatB [Paracoccaceae bacterium]
MLDLGWTELLVIGIVALIVVGPKDLPKMFRTLGQFTAKARAMAREFQRAMDDAADSTGVKDVARDLRKATDLKGAGMDELNSWDPMREDKAEKPARNAPETDPDDEEALDRAAAEMDTMREAHKAKKARPSSATADGATAPASAAQGRTTAAASAEAPAKTPAAAKPRASTGARATAGAKAPAKTPAKGKARSRTKAPASDTAADKGSS